MLAAATGRLLLLGAMSVTAMDQIIRCGTPFRSDPPSLLRSRSADDVNPGESTDPRRFPWAVLIEYTLGYGGKRDPCVGTLISDRHVLTARVCVDADGPLNRSDNLLQPQETQVRLGLMQNYGGLYNASKIRALPNLDLAVIEIPKIEFKEYVRPICPSDRFDYVQGAPVETLYWKPHKGERKPALMQVQVDAIDLGKCKDEVELMKEYPYEVTNKDYLCVFKEYLLCVEGVCTGAPVMWTSDKVHKRWLQHGIIVRADEDHNVALVMRVDANAELIHYLTNCYLVGSGLDTVQSPTYPSHC